MLGRERLSRGNLVEFVCSEKMCVCDVADVCPVEKVRVVANLPMCLAALPCIEETCDALPIARSTKGASSFERSL